MSDARRHEGGDPHGDRLGDAAPSGDGRSVEAVLLDIDGTLIDSNDAHAQAWSDTLREAGHDIGSEAVLPLVGMGSDKLLPQLTGIDAESEEGKRLVERRKEVFAKEYLPSIRPFPRVLDLLDRLRADGLQLVVATSASDEELGGLLTALGAEWLREDATSSSDADRSKPDPDIVRAAVDRAGVGPASCVMIGDTPYDVAAATRAGVRIVGVRCGGWGDDDLRGAIAVYDDPAQLLDNYDESVFGRRTVTAERDAGRTDTPVTYDRNREQPDQGEAHVDGA